MGLKPPRRAFANEDGTLLRMTNGKAGGSGRRKIAAGDYDGDGKFDLIVNSFNADVLCQTEEADGIWRFKNLGRVGDKRLQGHSSHPTLCDFNADGIFDLLIGAEDGHCYYLRNPRAKEQ